MVLEHILTLVHEPPKSKRWTSLDEAVNALMAEEVLPLFSNAEEDNWKVWKPRFQREITKRALDNEKKTFYLPIVAMTGNVKCALLGETVSLIDKHP